MTTSRTNAVQDPKPDDTKVNQATTPLKQDSSCLRPIIIRRSMTTITISLSLTFAWEEIINAPRVPFLLRNEARHHLSVTAVPIFYTPLLVPCTNTSTCETAIHSSFHLAKVAQVHRLAEGHSGCPTGPIGRQGTNAADNRQELPCLAHLDSTLNRPLSELLASEVHRHGL